MVKTIMGKEEEWPRISINLWVLLVIVNARPQVFQSILTAEVFTKKVFSREKRSLLS